MLLAKTESAFEELYATQAGGVQRFVLGIVGNTSVAEEITQEAFTRAWKGLPLFSFQSSLKTWVYSVALNAARDWLRSHRHHSADVITLESTTEAPLSIEARAIREALSELDADTRILLMLHYYDDLDLGQIAQILEIPTGTVKSRLHTAKAKLRPLLERKGFDV